MEEQEIIAWKHQFRNWLSSYDPRREMVARRLRVSRSIVNQWAAQARRKRKDSNGEIQLGEWYFPRPDRRAEIDEMMRYYTIPWAWEDETCVVIGTGPSLTQAQVDYCRGKARVITVNDAHNMAPWADHLHASDAKWWRWYYEETKQFLGVKTTVEPPAADFPDVMLLNNTGLDGFDYDPAHCRTGCNGGYQAAHIAAHYGVSRILLIGMDHRVVEGKAHFFGDHPDNIRSEYGTWNWHWQTLVEPFYSMGIEVINCTPDSALTVFPMRRLEDVL